MSGTLHIEMFIFFEETSFCFHISCYWQRFYNIAGQWHHCKKEGLLNCKLRQGKKVDTTHSRRMWGKTEHYIYNYLQFQDQEQQVKRDSDNKECWLIQTFYYRLTATFLVATFRSQGSTIQVQSAQNCSFWVTRHLGRSPRCIMAYWGLQWCTRPCKGHVQILLYLGVFTKNLVIPQLHIMLK